MASRIFTPGTRVELMLSGLWCGTFTVTHHGGRSSEHLVLRADDGTCFEVYNDAPHNIREVTAGDPRDRYINEVTQYSHED
jgi:hypothetical protein